jgi:phosphoglycolate phosphatase-like HAD superfamily hydrolase
MPGETWVFDVDGCLVDSLTGTSIRPGALDLLDDLRRAHRRIVLWSAGGAEYAEDHATRLGIHARFDAFLGKDERGQDGRYVTDGIAPELTDVVFVDDRPEDLPAAADVVRVSPYLTPNAHDRGLAPVARRAALAAPDSLNG